MNMIFIAEHCRVCGTIVNEFRTPKIYAAAPDKNKICLACEAKLAVEATEAYAIQDEALDIEIMNLYNPVPFIDAVVSGVGDITKALGLEI